MPTVGEEYDGRVKNIQAYGAFVEIAAGKDGLLHISEIDWKRINNVEDVLKVDDPVRVKIIDVDVKTGKMKFSRKVLLPRPESKNE
jgi:polyribonucleotide nucleotidyltransferase